MENKSTPRINITESSPVITSAEHTRHPIEEEQAEEFEEGDLDSLLSTMSSPSGTVRKSKRKANLKLLKTPTPKKRRSCRMSIPKDWDSRAELDEETPRSDGLDPEILDYYMNKAFKSSPAYLDLKAKRFNSSFSREVPRHREIEIFTPEEEAEFAEESRRLYGDQPRDEADAIAAANRFADVLTKLELQQGIDYDKTFEEFDRKIEEEIKESRKQAKYANKTRKGKKKNDPPADNTGFCFWKVLDKADFDEMPKHPTIEKEEDLLARWQAEVKARKKKSVPISSSEEPLVGPSYLSSFDPSPEDNAVMSTPKPNKKKSSMKETEVLKKSDKKGTKKLAFNQVPKKKTERKK